MARFTPRLTHVRWEDEVGLGMTIGPGQGDLSHGPINAHNAEIVDVYDRDQFDGEVLGQDLAQEGSITVSMKNEKITHATQARVNDFVLRRGAFDPTKTTSVSATPGLWAFKIILTFFDGVTSTTRTLPHCTGDIAFAEGRPGHAFAMNYRNKVQVIDA